MRIRNALKNVSITLFYTSVTLIINFISRSVFINYLGNETVGLNTVLLNIISILNITDLGITSAVAYSLYTPLAKGEKSRIADIINLYQKLFKVIACVVLGLGILVVPFLKLIIDVEIPFFHIVIYYFILLSINIINYLFTYRYILLNANQKGYVIKKYTGLFTVIKSFAQIGGLIVTRDYLSWLVLEFVFNLIIIFVINRKIKTIYDPGYFKSNKNFKLLLKNYKNILKDTKDIFWHKVASLIVFQTDGILLSIFSNLAIVGIYSNYMMIVNSITNIIVQTQGSIVASIGNLATEKDNNKSYEVWEKLYSLDFFIATIIIWPLYIVIQDFMVIWIGNDVLFSNGVVFTILINAYILLIRVTMNNYKTAYGIFWDKYAPILEGLINLLFSIILTMQIGFVGVFIGTIISNLVIVLIWIPYTVFKYALNKSYYSYLHHFIKLLTLSCVSMLVTNKFLQMIVGNITVDNFLIFLIKGTIAFIVTTLITFLIFMSFHSAYRKLLLKLIDFFRGGKKFV